MRASVSRVAFDLATTAPMIATAMGIATTPAVCSHSRHSVRVMGSVAFLLRRCTFRGTKQGEGGDVSPPSPHHASPVLAPCQPRALRLQPGQERYRVSGRHVSCNFWRALATVVTSDLAPGHAHFTR